MKEYIEREAAILALGEEPVVWGDYDMDGRTQSYAWSSHKRGIERVPAADVAPVRHAKCEKIDLDDGKVRWRCSKCKREILRYDPIEYRYCPNCGARMDKEADHD